MWRINRDRWKPSENALQQLAYAAETLDEELDRKVPDHWKFLENSWLTEKL